MRRNRGNANLSAEIRAPRGGFFSSGFAVGARREERLAWIGAKLASTGSPLVGYAAPPCCVAGYAGPVRGVGWGTSAAARVSRHIQEKQVKDPSPAPARLRSPVHSLPLAWRWLPPALDRACSSREEQRESELLETDLSTSVHLFLCRCCLAVGCGSGEAGRAAARGGGAQPRRQL